MKYLRNIMLLCIVIELSSLFSIFVISKISGINLIYLPNSDYDLENYHQVRDSITGWPSKSLLKKRHLYTEDGSRPNPYKIMYDSTEIMVVGDSFARGDEVKHEDCWSNKLSLALNAKVINYGVSGFGTDQALLRYYQNVKPESKIIIVGFTSDNILRNVNTFRNLLTQNMRFPGFKPRFILSENGKLKHQKLPGKNVEEISAFIQNPLLLGSNEYFLSDEGPQSINFPFSFSMLKLFRHYLIKSKLRGEAYYKAFFDEGHPSEALPLTTEILYQFSEYSRSKKVLYVFFPQNIDFIEFEKSGEWIYEPLVKSLLKKDSSVQILNIGEAFIKQPDFFAELSSYFSPRFHYNVQGNQVVATALEDKLKKLNWLN